MRCDYNNNSLKASSPSRRAGPDCHGMHSDGEIHLWRCPLYHNFRKISSALPIHGIPKNQNLHNSVISIQNPQNFFGKVKFTIKQHFIHRLQQLRARFLIFWLFLFFKTVKSGLNCKIPLWTIKKNTIHFVKEKSPRYCWAPVLISTRNKKKKFWAEIRKNWKTKLSVKRRENFFGPSAAQNRT